MTYEYWSCAIDSVPKELTHKSTVTSRIRQRDGLDGWNGGVAPSTKIDPANDG